MKSKFQNGDVVRDTVTGFKGMVVGTTLWLNGCYRYTVQSQTLKDGKPLDGEAFDELQLELVTPKQKEGRHDTGGPRPNVTPSKEVRKF